MEQKKICPARKLTWDEIAHLMDLEIQGVLNRSVHCRAFLEDTLYWGAAATDYRFSIAELKELLWAAHAELDDWKETIPSDSDGSKSLGMGLSNCLLHSALHAEWECEHCTEEALWLLNYRELSGKQETETEDILNLPGVSVRVSELKTRHDLLSYLFENGPSHSSLMDFCDSYRELYHNELCWPYPISDGKHLGTFLVPVREGILSLPFDEADKADYETFCLEDAKTFSAEDMAAFLDDWSSFSKELSDAMEMMQKFLQRKERQNGESSC